MNRRELLQAAVAGSVGIALIGVQRACLAHADFRATIRHPFLTADQSRSIAAIAELIIPETDTPGAIEAGVPEFIELMLSDWYTGDERRPTIDGIEKLDAHSREFSQRVFADADPTLQHELLSATQDSDFFRQIKSLTVYGYYSSEIGATAELRFDPAPGRYTTIDFAEVGRQWVS
jgi:glucoside 3-dehydrogenase (cytochrome c) hitch-hiker subunit